jgi:spore coat polysaccharide biosynthesis protein SpsF
MQARTSSTRLPDKVLLPILDKPVLLHQYERMAQSKLATKIVVATSIDRSDDILARLCEDNGIECFRGDLKDLLDRHYKAAKKFHADIVVKIPSDCPLISPDIIDLVIGRFLELYPDIDYVSNLHPPSFPDGNDVEVMSMTALAKAWRFSEKNYELEHTTPYIWENSSKFKIQNVQWNTGLNLSKSHRFTIDYIEDYYFIDAIFQRLYPDNNHFTLSDIMGLLEKEPELLEINGQYHGEYWYKNHQNELKTIIDYYPEYSKVQS